MRAKDIMTKKVIVVHDTDTIDKVAKLLIKNEISGVPVVNSENKLVGILSEGDLVFQQKKLTPPFFLSLFDGFIQIGKSTFFEEMKKISAFEVKDLMTKDNLVIAQEDTEISELATLIIKNRVNRIPIVNANNEVVGIITRHDIVKANYKEVMDFRFKS